MLPRMLYVVDKHTQGVCGREHTTPNVLIHHVKYVRYASQTHKIINQCWTSKHFSPNSYVSKSMQPHFYCTVQHTPEFNPQWLLQKIK